MANMLNQSGFADHDGSVKPRAIFLMLAVPAWIVGLFTLGILGFLPSKPGAPSQLAVDLLLVPLDLLAAAFIVWVAYGWVVGLVPFVACPADELISTTSSWPEGQPMGVRLTGVVELAVPGIRRRYRSRPTSLALEDGTVDLVVHRWKSAWLGRERMPAAVVELGANEILGAVRGTVHLVSNEMPGIRIATPQGPLIVAFHTCDARDRVFNALRAIASAERD
jgi:hypothetical protein